MQSRAIFVVAFLLFSSAAALAESRAVCQSMPRPYASSCDTAVLPVRLRSEGAFAQAFARSLCRPRAPLCTSAGTITASANGRAVSINYSTRQQWASSQ
jgi:hypothetical protein